MQQQYQCPRCGAPVAFGARFCGNCGVQLDWPTQQIQPPPSYQQPQQQSGYKYGQAKTKQRRTSSWLIVSVILIVVLLLIGGGVFAFNAISGKTLSVSDVTAPIITNVVASPTETTAVITWTTDEAATSQVEYGNTTGYDSASALDVAPVVSHSITLSILEPNTTYHFKVKSRDKAGNQAVSEDDTFITSASKPPPEDKLTSAEAFKVFTDPIGKFSVEYPSSWFIDSVSGEDAPHLSFNVVLEPDLEWDKEIDLGFVYDYHSLIGNAKWFNDMFIYLADEDLISANSYTVGSLTCWECKDKIGEHISVLIDCDWEGGLLHLHYGYPIDTLTETEVNTLKDYALHMLSTFHVQGQRISERELNIHKLVNEKRKLEGLVPLELNEFISGLAREHSNQQSWLNKPLQKGLGINHEGFDERAEKIFSTLGASIVGENIAIGYYSSASVVEAWMNSPEHKENILNPKFRRTGIGSTGFFENSIYTQIFSD
jgi:uncharacterized protein YkwD